MSLRSRFILIYGVGSIFFLALITLLVFSRMETVMIKQLQQQFYLNAEKKISSLNDAIQGLENSYRSISSIPMFRSMRYHQLTLNEAALRNDIRQLELFLLRFQQQHEEINRIRFLTEKGQEAILIKGKMIIRKLANMGQDAQVKKALTNSAKDIHVSIVQKDAQISDIVWWIPINISSDVDVGVMEVSVSFSYLDNLIRNLEDESTWICLRDKRQHLVNTGGSISRCSDTRLKSWESSYDLYLPGYEWTIQLMVDPQAYLGEVNNLRFLIYGIVFPAVAIVVFTVIYFNSLRITNVIEKLVDVTRTLGTDEKYQPAGIDRNDELGFLAREIDRTAQVIKERTSALVSSNEELESYSYSIAHDLRSPLRTIAGFCEILKFTARDKLDDSEQNKLDRIMEASNKMGDLIDDILQLSRITRQDIRSEPVNLSQLATDILQDYQRVDKEREVNWQIGEDLVQQGDPVLLRVLLENLLGNAWKYTQNCPLADIYFDSRMENGRKVYYIKDNGAGFSMQYAEKLFKPFERLHSESEFEGTGIGLATVKRIITRHHGDIWIESETGQGTTVSFRFDQ